MTYSTVAPMGRIIQRLRARGVSVVEVGGWQTRGHGDMSSILGVVCHHTAGAATGDYPSLGVVRDGRAGLSGPLAHWGIGRSGTVYVIAAGLCYHAGVVKDKNFSNSHAYGIEAENTGRGEAWGANLLASYAALCAEIRREHNLGETSVRGHKEVCAPTGRKSDPTFEMNVFRQSVTAALGIQLTTAAATIREIIMAAVDEQLPQGNHYSKQPESLGWAVRELEPRIVDRLTTVITDQVKDLEATLAGRLDQLPKQIADEILGRKVSTPTWRDGKVVQEDTPVASLVARAAEASITRHREEQGAKAA